MAPNLGWIDVPLGTRLARALVSRRADQRRERRRCRCPRRVPPWRGGGVDNVLYHLGRGRRRRRADRRRPPAHRRRGLRRRDRPPDCQPVRRAVPLRLGRAAGRPRSARACCSPWPAPGRRRAGRDRRRPARGRGGLRDRARGDRARRPLAGHRARGPRERPQPAAGDPRRAKRPAATRSSGTSIDAELSRFALPASRALVRVVPATLGVDAPLVGAAEMAFDPLISDPAAWFGQRDGAFHLASA